jgi:signal peptide peptidase SppA
MKIKRNLAMILAQPWAIRAASMAAIMETMAYKTAAQDIIIAELEPEEEREAYETEDGIATIKIEGVIGKKLPKWMAEIFGMTDVDDIAALMELANSDTEVRGIMLDIDSPGGSVTGIPELAQQIRDSEKPVFAYSDNLMASAAYWLASGASGIFASESALVGSIGAFIPIADMRRMYEMAGIEMEIIKAGDLKAAGYPGTSLTQGQRDDFRKSIEHVYSMFTTFVLDRQGADPVPESAMQGQDFYGDQALGVGLVDEIATRRSVIEELKKYA